MRLRQLKQLAQGLCPPLMWDMVSRNLGYFRRRVGLGLVSRWTSLRLVRTLDELDREIARGDEAAKVSHEALQAVLHSFRYEPAIQMPTDPFSEEYREAQWELYRHVSGRADYTPDACEMTEVYNAPETRLFPYSSRSSTTVGEHLMAIGFLLRAIDLKPGQRILEFGPGWGKTTIELALMGNPVTAVDINPRFLDIIKTRCQRLGIEVTVECADMLKYSSATRFDRVIFYECFHHCSDHVEMIRRLGDLLTDEGVIVFAGEPIDDLFPYPWGLRLDGQSAWSIRKYGWLELGFQTSYFKKLLATHGWQLTMLPSRDVVWQRVFVARRAQTNRASVTGRRAARANEFPLPTKGERGWKTTTTVRAC